MKETIQLMQVVGDLETYVSHKEFDKAEAHIKHWTEEAIRLGDKMSELAIHNEAMLYFRDQKNREEALAHADAAVAILQDPSVDTSRGEATVLMNAAGIYRKFGEKDKALFLYVKAVDVYEKMLDADDPRLANIYNNIALSFCLLGEYTASMELYEKAIAIVRQKKEGELEEAMTQLNIAEMFNQQYGPEAGKEKIAERVELAKSLIDKPELTRDTYYGLVCQKLAAGFEHLGYFDYQKEIKARATRVLAANQKNRKI